MNVTTTSKLPLEAAVEVAEAAAWTVGNAARAAALKAGADARTALECAIVAYQAEYVKTMATQGWPLPVQKSG